MKISPKEEGTSSSSGVGLARRMVWVEEFVFCAQVTNHPPSISTEVFFFTLCEGGQECHENFEESHRKPLSKKMNTGDKGLCIIQEIPRSSGSLSMTLWTNSHQHVND